MKEEKTKMKKILVLTLLVLFLMTGVSYADNFTLNESGYVGGAVIGATFPNGSYYTVAAYYQMTFAGQTYMGYCVDYANIYWNTLYTNYTMISVPNSGPNNSKGYVEAAYLFDKYGTQSSTWGANVQIAIWTILFNPFTLLTYPSSVDPGTINSYVLEAYNHQNFDASAYRLLVSPNPNGYYGVGSQDFIVKTPEPGSLMLLGAGLLFLGLFRRPRRAK